MLSRRQGSETRFRVPGLGAWRKFSGARGGSMIRDYHGATSRGWVGWIGESRSIQVIDLFWNYWREFSVCYGRKAKKGGTLNGVLSQKEFGLPNFI